MEQTALKQLNAWLDDHRQDMIRDLTALCSIRSVSEAGGGENPFGKGCREALDWMLRLGDREGFATRNFENYVGSIVWSADGDSGRDIGVWAHLDVVPEGEGWASPPYSPEIRDGWLFGRGVSDNKNAAVGAFYIMKGMRELGFPLRSTLRLFLGTSEETGMQDALYYKEHYPMPSFSIVPDAGFPGSRGEFGRIEFDLLADRPLSEDFCAFSGGSVCNIVPDRACAVLHKRSGLTVPQTLGEGISVTEGEDTVEITAHGVSSHAASPQEGVNAIDKLVCALLQIPGLCGGDRETLAFLHQVNLDGWGSGLSIQNEDDISGRTVCSGTVLRLEEGRPRITCDCRFCVTDNSGRLLASIQEKAAAGRFTVQVNARKEPRYVSDSHPVLLAMEEVYRSCSGDREARFTISKGGTYAGRLPDALGTGICLHRDHYPQPDLPEGHGGMHQADEALPIEGFMEGVKVLAAMIAAVDRSLAQEK